jgi:hypothetical protein
MSLHVAPIWLLAFGLIGGSNAIADSLYSEAACAANAPYITNAQSCLIQNLPYYSVEAAAATNVQGGVAAIVYASASAETNDSQGGFFYLSAGATAQINQTFSTSGIARPGLISLDVQEENLLSTGVIDLEISDGQHAYSFCCLVSPQPCVATETVPFELGTNFYVVDDVTAASTGVAGLDIAQRVSADLTFTVEESDGTASCCFEKCSLTRFSFSPASIFVTSGFSMSTVTR